MTHIGSEAAGDAPRPDASKWTEEMDTDTYECEYEYEFRSPGQAGNSLGRALAGQAGTAGHRQA